MAEEKADEKESGFLGDFLGWIGSAYDGSMSWLAEDTSPMSRLVGTVIASQIQKFSQPKMPQVGYQGKVDMDLERVRERVPTNFGPSEGRKTGIMTGVSSDNRLAGDIYARGERRPGANAQRYFTDTIYAKRPDTEIPTVAEAEAKAN